MWFNTRWSLSSLAVNDIRVDGFSAQWRHASYDIDSIIHPTSFPMHHLVHAADGDYDGHHCEKWVINITMVLKHSPSTIGKRLQTGSVPASSAGSVSFIVIYLSAHLIWCYSAFRPAVCNVDWSAMKVIDKLNVLTGPSVDGCLCEMSCRLNYRCTCIY